MQIRWTISGEHAKHRQLIQVAQNNKDNTEGTSHRDKIMYYRLQYVKLNEILVMLALSRRIFNSEFKEKYMKELILRMYIPEQAQRK